MLLVSRLQRKASMFLRAAALTVVLLASASARAEETLPGGLTLKFNRLLIHEGGGALSEPSNPNEATWQYFNKAHCTCALKQPDFDESSFAWEITPQSSTTAVSLPVAVYTGADCDNLTNRSMT